MSGEMHFDDRTASLKVEKPWGRFEQYTHNLPSTVKIGRLPYSPIYILTVGCYTEHRLLRESCFSYAIRCAALGASCSTAERVSCASSSLYTLANPTRHVPFSVKRTRNSTSNPFVN